MGYRKIRFLPLRSFTTFAVRNWQLLALSHPHRAGSGATKENGIGKKRRSLPRITRILSDFTEKMPVFYQIVECMVFR
jgi:hypothetical protein